MSSQLSAHIVSQALEPSLCDKVRSRSSLLSDFGERKVRHRSLCDSAIALESSVSVPPPPGGIHTVTDLLRLPALKTHKQNSCWSRKPDH